AAAAAGAAHRRHRAVRLRGAARPGRRLRRPPAAGPGGARPSRPGTGRRGAERRRRGLRAASAGAVPVDLQALRAAAGWRRLAVPSRARGRLVTLPGARPSPAPGPSSPAMTAFDPDASFHPLPGAALTAMRIGVVAL